MRSGGGSISPSPTVPPCEAVADFGDPQAEYEALVHGAGVVPLERTQIELCGADRARFLHNLCTNDVKALLPGQGREAFFTNVQGKIVGHGFIFCGAESLVIDSVPGQAETLLTHLDRYLITEKVELHNRSDVGGELLIAGTDTENLLAQRLGIDVPSECLNHIERTLDGHAVSVRRTDLTSPVAFLLSIDRAAVQAVWSAVGEAGARPCGQRAFDMARIEAGTPLYGQDITDRNLPQEVARDNLAISFTKGCYLGQETVARIDALGHVNRTLCGLQFDGEVPEPGVELAVDGKTVGHITSSAFSPRLNAPLALGYVRREHHQPGTTLDSPAGQATVVALPVS